MLAAEVDQELLRLRAKAGSSGTAAPRSGSARVLKMAFGPVIERRAFGRIDDLDRLAVLLQLEQIVVVAVGHHGALAERELLRRIGRGLHLHDALLGELLEIVPAELARDLEGRGHDRAADRPDAP